MFPVHFHAAASVGLLSAAPQESLSHYSHVLHLSKFPEKKWNVDGLSATKVDKEFMSGDLLPRTLN